MRCRQCGLNSCCGSDLEQQLQQAEAQVAEYKRRSGNLCDALVSHIDWESDQPQMKAWLLRKQAEAVEKAAMQFGGRDFIVVRIGLSEQAQHLRQQAGELER